MRATFKRRAFYESIRRLTPAIAQDAEDMVSEEEARAGIAASPEPAARVKRVWWAETADGRRLRL